MGRDISLDIRQHGLDGGSIHRQLKLLIEFIDLRDQLLVLLIYSSIAYGILLFPFDLIHKPLNLWMIFFLLRGRPGRTLLIS